MTGKQELLVEQTYADYIDSDVLGYRAKREAEEERKRLLKEKKSYPTGKMETVSYWPKAIYQGFLFRISNGGDYIERENGR